MVHSVLLYLDGSASTEPVIEAGVNIATRHQARVRGVTLADTRSMKSLAANCEAAVYSVMEQGRLECFEQLRRTARVGLSQACLSAGLNFEVRHLSGDPFELLPLEAQFNDLVVTGYLGQDHAGDEEHLTARQLVELLFRGMQPLLVVRHKGHMPGRALLVHDGTPAAARAIKTYVAQRLFPGAEHRLLAVGESEDHARQHLREMADYCRSQWLEFETGIACGSLRRMLLPYATKWQADLLVLGVTRGNRVLSRLLGDVARDVLRRTSCALYACG